MRRQQHDPATMTIRKTVDSTNESDDESNIGAATEDIDVEKTVEECVVESGGFVWVVVVAKIEPERVSTATTAVVGGKKVDG